MILRPIADAAAVRPAEGSARSAWEVVAETQQREAQAWWLIAQSDHARISGEMAARMELPGLAPPAAEALRGIALHDAGWEPVDAAALRSGARPCSFLHAAPEVALRAWAGSIETAEGDNPLAGFLVSRHFWRLGSTLGEAAVQNDQQREMLRRFLAHEQARQQALLARSKTAADRADRLVDLLQFCDLLSLYLCCGARTAAAISSPAGGSLTLRWREDDNCLLEPSPLRDALPMEVRAQRFPGGEHTTLRFALR